MALLFPTVLFIFYLYLLINQKLSRGGLKWATWGRVKLYHFVVCSCT